MFEEFLKPKKKTEEERLLDKQLDAQDKQNTFATAADVQADQFYLENQKEKEDLVRWQQDLNEEIRELKLQLRRKYIDEDGRIVSMKDREGNDLPPLCNEHLIEDISIDLSPLTSRNLMMSNFQEGRILNMLKRTAGRFVIKTGLYHNYYGVAYHNISPIINLYKNYIIPAPFRALNNGERKHLDTINKRIETFNETSQQKEKKGVFG